MAAVDTPTEVRAEAKYVHTAPRKAQLVVAEIRGLRVAEARSLLAFMPRAAARDVEDVLKSAVANAEANHGLSGDDLYVSAAYVGSGPTLKRWRARARGRVGKIKKRTCHITIRVAPVEVAAGLHAPAKKATEPVPAPARSRRPKVEVPAAPEATVVEASAPAAEKPEGAAAAQAPKPRRPRAKAAAPRSKEKPVGATPASPEAKPARAPRKKSAESEPKEEGS
jgi:large subunit ribosomal protein L22